MKNPVPAFIAAGLFAFVSPGIAVAPVSAGQFSLPVNAAAVVNRSCAITETSITLDFGAVTLVNGSLRSANIPSASIPVTCTAATPLSISFLAARPVESVAGTSPIAISTYMTSPGDGANSLSYIIYAGVSSAAVSTFPNSQFGSDTGINGGRYYINLVGNVLGGTLPRPDSFSAGQQLFLNF